MTFLSFDLSCLSPFSPCLPRCIHLTASVVAMEPIPATDASLTKLLPEVSYRSGFVALIGRPNVGKSTLLNRLVGEKVAITSCVAQTTRNRLRAILTTRAAQIVLLDTPGIHKPHHLLGERLVRSARSAIGDVDVVAHAGGWEPTGGSGGRVHR